MRFWSGTETVHRWPKLKKAACAADGCYYSQTGLISLDILIQIFS